MSNSRTPFNTPKKKKPGYTPTPLVIFWDWDHVLYDTPEEKDDTGELIDPETLTETNQLSIRHHIPNHIVTANPESEKPLIIEKLKSLPGFEFSKTQGGFHEEDIHCLGIETKKRVLIGLKQPKAKRMNEIWKEKFPQLDKKLGLFIDDNKTHTDLAEKEGFTILLAKKKENGHMQQVLTHVKNTIENARSQHYTSSLTFFEMNKADDNLTENFKRISLTLER